MVGSFIGCLGERASLGISAPRRTGAGIFMTGRGRAEGAGGGFKGRVW